MRGTTGPVDATRALRGSALVGVLAYALVRALPLEHGRDPMSRAVLLGALVIVPLALSLTAPPARLSRLFALAAIAQPLGALAVTIALALPPGPIGGALASVWMSVALLVALFGLARLRALGSADHRMAELGLAAGPILLPVGAAWLVASRMGLRAFGFDPVIVLLTAVHFHYAALAMPILIGLSIRRAPGALLAASLFAVLVAIPLVALGITISPAVAAAGAVLLALGLLAHAAVAGVRVLPTLRGWPARGAMAIALLSPVLSMPLAVAWSLSQLGIALPIPLDLDLMLRLHGQANAHGVVGMGLVAWWLDSRHDRPQCVTGNGRALSCPSGTLGLSLSGRDMTDECRSCLQSQGTSISSR